MLNDDRFKSAQDNQFPLLSPKGITVWIKGMSFHHLLDEDAEVTIHVNITLYADENDVQRVMDTRTFKESFDEVPEFHIQKQKPGQLNPKNINAAKAMGYLK